VLEELDVELGLRQRLYETVHSRLSWALLLQEALEKGYPVGTSLISRLLLWTHLGPQKNRASLFSIERCFL